MRADENGVPGLPKARKSGPRMRGGRSGRRRRSARRETGSADRAGSRSPAPAAASSRPRAVRVIASRRVVEARHARARSACAPRGDSCGNAIDAAEEIDVLFDGQIVVEREFLRHVADVLAHLLRLRRRHRSRAPSRARKSASAVRKGCEWWSISPRRSDPESRRSRPSRPASETWSTATKLPNASQVVELTRVSTGRHSCLVQPRLDGLDERGFQRAAGRLHCFRSVAAHQFSLVHQADAIASLRFVQVRRGHEDRDAVLQQLIKNRPEIAARDGIDAIGRLVQEAEFAAGAAACTSAPASASCRPKAVPAWRWRKAPCASCAAARGLSSRLSRGDTEQVGIEIHVFFDSQVGIKSEALRHVADAGL